MAFDRPENWLPKKMLGNASQHEKAKEKQSP
jgi:hypothetical protein